MTKSLLYVLTAICVLVGPSMALSDQCALVLPFMVFYGLALSCMYVIFVNCMACVWPCIALILQYINLDLHGLFLQSYRVSNEFVNDLTKLSITK